ncbi:hypothetical protein ZBT109_0983 [Zymobacter palmae]|uniref:Uncharacterized protein n=1 Tax=Zymobacter palmae TaxID=33074 RepID=A0A348HDQ0_9GAMM|nr:hypothetical protein ZBT109_0983 [Zymobacter palmae]
MLDERVKQTHIDLAQFCAQCMLYFIRNEMKASAKRGKSEFFL